MKTAKATCWHFLLTLLLSLLVCPPPTHGVGPDDNEANQVSLQDLFNVKAGTTHGGLDGHFDIVESWLRDTATLVNHVLAAMPAEPDQVDATNTALGRNLKAWFGLRVRKNGGINARQQEQYRALRGRFQSVDRLLRKENPVFVRKRPWIFYNSDWQERTELWFDTKGRPLGENGRVIDPASRPQGNLRHIDPSQVSRLSRTSSQFLQEMQRGRDPDWENFAFWSSDIRDYELMNREDVHEFGQGGFCDQSDGKPYFGLTNTKMLEDVITLCPDAFTGLAEPFETIREGLVSDVATNNDLEVALEHTSPRSLTLFHELIHLTSGTEDTTDNGTKPPACLELIANGFLAEAQKNPDNLVFFAWSYYLESVGTPSFQWETGTKSR